MLRLTAVLVALSSAALAQEPSFPAKGQIVPLGGVSISYQTQGNSSLTQVLLAPTLLYLATDHLVLGADFAYRSSSLSGNSNSISSWGGDLIFGGAFRLAPAVSILLLPSIGYDSISSGSTSRNSVVLGGSAPLLIHLAPHFFVGIGPQLLVEVSASQSTSFGGSGTDKMTTFMFQGTFGGWI